MRRTVLVTGGSGAIGQAIVKKLVAGGWKTAFTWMHNEAKAEQLKEETGALAFKVDLSDHNEVRGFAKMLEEQLGSVYGLVNNAGVTQVMPFALIEPDDWDHIMNSNLKSMYLATHALVRGMIRNKQGVIVNMGSIAGHRVLEVPIHYASVKAAVSGFTVSLARELARYNVRVNEVVPGMLEEGVSKLVPEAEMKEYLHYCLARRPGKCSEVAELVEFLLSDRSSYINAQSIHINGGI
ncbi:MAG: SDR family oxidoreductase [Desulfarculales bacterium]|jgi:3-oxoacyl-[acyl-carrier protein] reductase|nr:SDR family oxidoreductase [Desulfarculales bacterium]